MSRRLTTLRVAFAAWILLASVGSFVNALAHGVPPGVPASLVTTIAGIEAASALAFALRPGGLALAGLCSTISATWVVHLMLGRAAWILPLYVAAAVVLYLLPPTSKQVSHHGQIGTQ